VTVEASDAPFASAASVADRAHSALQPGAGPARHSAMRRQRRVRVAVTAALLVAAGAGLSGCEASRLRAEAGAKAAESAAIWNDPAVQERWSTALVVEPPLFDAPAGHATELVLASVRRGLVEPSPEITDEGGQGVVDDATASDNSVQTLGARSALRAFTDPHALPCPDFVPCEPVKVTRATPTTMLAETARGTATVPAWSFEVDGMPAPLVLPAVRVAGPGDVAPGQAPSGWVSLLARGGSTLRVTLVAPFCGSHYQRHLLETDAVVVVWATGAPDGSSCAAAVEVTETFTLRSPIGDRPVVDSIAGLVLPETPLRPQIP
jgi:hypothetical protein